MKQADLISAVAGSSEVDWEVMHPVSLQDLSPHDDQGFKLRHSHRAVLLPQVEISLEWGLPEDGGMPVQGIWSSWSKFPDKSVYSIFAELLFFGSVIHRQKLVLADDARIVLPSPTPEVKPGKNPIVERWVTTASSLRIPRLINLLQGRPSGEFEKDLKTAGFAVVDQI